MTMASTEPRRGIRRWIYLGLVLIALAVAAYYGIVGGLKNCRWLDRLFGISGCIASHRVTGLRPGELWRTMVVPAGGDTIVFVGEEASDAKPLTIVLVVLDAATGAEKLRTVVAKTSESVGIVGSADSQRIALVCYDSRPCFEDGSTAITVSPSDGKRLEAFRRERNSLNMWRFPTDPDRPSWAYKAAALPGGELVVGEFYALSRKHNVEIRRIADESVVKTLRTKGGDFITHEPEDIAVSPSGRLIATLSLTPATGSDVLLSVFDTASGMQVTSFTIKESVGSTVAWAGKEDRLVLVRPVVPRGGYLLEATDLRFDVYALPTR
jgi:hypothetical protein